MINLKTLLFEGSSQVKLTEPFTLSDNDPWEYYVDDKTEIVYTRKKGTTKWLDMKSRLSDTSYKTAVNRILKRPRLSINSDDNKKDTDQDNKKIKKHDQGITRDDLGYIISGKSSVYGKTISLRTNMQNAGIVILKQLDIDDINRKMGTIDHGVTDVVTTLYPEESKYYQVGDIKTITMPMDRGAYSKQEDPNSGRKFTYLYIVGTNGYKGWIPSNTVKINS